LFPSLRALIRGYTKRGTNKQYPVMNQYSAGFTMKCDVRNGNNENNKRKK
jgi:hypothetical protein